MERLTKKHYKDENGYYISCSENCDRGDCNSCLRFSNIVDTLGQIEDILGDEYDLDRLKELVQADREERCVVHPLKSDDEVYIILLSRVFLFEVTSAVWYRESPIYKAMHGIHLCYVFNQDDIGKTVFLTREEAEAALERMEGEEK